MLHCHTLTRPSTRPPLKLVKRSVLIATLEILHVSVHIPAFQYISRNVTNFQFETFAATNVVMWYYNGSSLLFQNQIRMRQEPRYTIDTNHTLTIVDAQPSDHSEFRCTVLPNQVTLIAKLEVQTQPTANIYGSDGRDITNSSITVHQGEHVEIECKGTGRPDPTIKWFADGARVANTHGVHVSDGIMLIDSADHHHVRTYQCLTDNTVSVGHASINVIVQRKFQSSVPRNSNLFELFSSIFFSHRFTKSIIASTLREHSNRR